MKHILQRLLPAGFLVVSMGAQAQIVYNVDRTIGAGSISGTIETNGTIGSLDHSDILSWSFEAFDGTDTIAISSATGGTLQGNAWTYLSATQSQLLFDFDGAIADTNVEFISFHGQDNPQTYSFDYNLLGNFLGKLEQLVHQFGVGGNHRVDALRQGVELIGLVDQDGDGVTDSIDNCPAIPNADQANYDDDEFGDACDADDDNDGVMDEEDEFPFDPTESADSDDDGVGDNADAFPNDPSESIDTDGDRIGNNEDSDDDNDNVADIDDNCPLDANESQEDNESDGLGDACDTDDDNDGVADAQDDYPLGRFADALPDHWAFIFIEALGRAGITAGCGGNNYCPQDLVTRAQMAVFLERGMNGSDFSPQVASGNTFMDVAATDFAASFIEQLSRDGITAGCGNNNYCPNDIVTRSQMAVFMLRARYGAGYSPPPATGIFDDVPLSYWAVHWIEKLAAEGITAGCGVGIYCPEAPVTRDQMAVFLVRTFGL